MSGNALCSTTDFQTVFFPFGLSAIVDDEGDAVDVLDVGNDGDMGEIIPEDDQVPGHPLVAVVNVVGQFHRMAIQEDLHIQDPSEIDVRVSELDVIIGGPTSCLDVRIDQILETVSGLLQRTPDQIRAHALVIRRITPGIIGAAVSHHVLRIDPCPIDDFPEIIDAVMVIVGQRGDAIVKEGQRQAVDRFELLGFFLRLNEDRNRGPRPDQQEQR